MDEQKESNNVFTPLEQTPVPVPNIDVPHIRTYKDDINQVVSTNNITTAKILITEQKRREDAEEKVGQTSIKRPTNIVALIASIVFIVGGVTSLSYFGYTTIVMRTISPVTIPASFLFIFDEEKMIDGTKDKFEIYENVERNIQEISNLKDGTYTDLVFYKNIPETEEKIRITSAEFFDIYQIDLPINVERSISQDFVYGIYKTNERLEPFIVVGLVDYENIFSAMFIWEQTLALDIKDLFPRLKNLFDISKRKISTNEEVATTTATTTFITATSSANSTKSTSKATTTVTIATTTATTTEELTQEQQIQQELEKIESINRDVRFIDLVFSNKDARAIRDSNGSPFFYYSFIDREKIIFAQDPKIVGEIIRKIKEKSLVR